MMVDWPIFVLGLVAVSIVLTAIRSIAREDQAARTEAAARKVAGAPP